MSCGREREVLKEVGRKIVKGECKDGGVTKKGCGRGRGRGVEVEERRVARSWWELMVEDDDEEWREKLGGREKRIGMQERKEERWLEKREERMRGERRHEEEEKARKLEK